MMLMYTNLRQAGVGGFSFVVYWSYSEVGNSGAWNHNFEYDRLYFENKAGAGYVRPVRAF